MTARLLMSGLIAGAALAGSAVPALAHTELVSSTPRAGATVAHLPGTITMTFSQAPQKVVSGRVLRAGSPVNRATRTRLNPRNARQVRITTRGDAVGRYTVVLRFVAPDGDTQVVVRRFQVKR